MRPMKTYDYDELRFLISDVKSVWIRSTKGEMMYYACGKEISLPRIRANNLEMCKTYSEKNPNFAYEYNNSTDMITIWDKTIEEFDEISALAFQEVDTCGMGIMAYDKYADNITGKIPTFQMRDSAINIMCDFLEFKRN